VQVAVGEEYGSRATPSNQRRLFPKVRPKTGHDYLIGRMAMTAFTVPAIDPAVAGAEMAPSKK